MTHFRTPSPRGQTVWTGELEGFAYIRFGGFEEQGGQEGDPPYARGSDRFIRWLEADKSFSPQPYWQLARVLEDAGHENMAGDLRYEGRERERSELGLTGGAVVGPVGALRHHWLRLPHAGRPVLRPYSHRHLKRRAMVLHRGRGPGGRVAALAPVGHLLMPAPNRADALNPAHPGNAAYNTRARGLQRACLGATVVPGAMA